MTSILSGFDATQSLLDIGRGNAPPGAPGISRRARALTSSFLAQSASNSNALFSNTSSGAYLSVEQLQILIQGLRSRVPESQLAPSLRGNNVDTEA